MGKGYAPAGRCLLCEWYLRVRKSSISTPGGACYRTTVMFCRLATLAPSGTDRTGAQLAYGGHMTGFIDRTSNGKIKAERQRFCAVIKHKLSSRFKATQNAWCILRSTAESPSLFQPMILANRCSSGAAVLLHRVHPATITFIQNDRIERPQGGGGGGPGSGQGQASQTGEGRDEFVFQDFKR